MKNRIEDIIKQFDKYYKLPIILGALVLVSGGFQDNLLIVKFGVLTFIFGLIFWPSASMCDIKINIQLNPLSKDTPGKILKRFLPWYISLLLIEIAIYTYLVILLFV